ncbi:MAG TPA: YdcF family protein [Acidimicrobiia bacterium]|nr:YdcF family protein [Acidimicrobiia bacterium]
MTTPVRQRVRQFLPWALASIAAVFAILTFVWFVNPPTVESEAAQPTDAVVVFAGNPARLKTAVELMENGVATNLVIPNGNTSDVRTDLCEDETSFQVFCPDTEEISTWGEAQEVGRLAMERGWSRLTAVTSVYHVHRATTLLRRCYEGEIEVVTPPRDIDSEWVGKVGHEWIGLLASIVLYPTC